MWLVQNCPLLPTATWSSTRTPLLARAIGGQFYQCVSVRQITVILSYIFSATLGLLLQPKEPFTLDPQCPNQARQLLKGVHNMHSESGHII